MPRSPEPKSAAYLLKLAPTEKQRLQDMAAERGLTLAALIRLGLEREQAAWVRQQKAAA